MNPPSPPIHAKISGPIVMIGFGSIGKGTLPLIERHFTYDKSRFVIIDPHEDGEIAEQHGVRFMKQAITRDNYREVLVPLLTAGGGQGFCVNLSVDTSSVDIMSMCREIGALYIDTVVEPWLGFYFDRNIGPEKRSNYALRETLLAAKHKSPGGTTGVRSWCQPPGAKYGFRVTHSESISIADYLTVRDGAHVIYRPTCHYAYHPANDAVLSLHEMFGATGKMQPKWHILDENEIEDGIDELGVLLYGHPRNAYWYGSQLSIEETRGIAPYQNATGMQVSSAVLAGMGWALENPTAGIVEADELDFRRCLEIQPPELGPVKGFYTDWTPLTDRPGLFPEDIDESDPWQFRNVLVR